MLWECIEEVMATCQGKHNHTFILARARTIREERRRGVQDVEGAVASCRGDEFVSGVMSEDGTESGIDESVGRISEDGQGPEYRARSCGRVKLRA